MHIVKVGLALLALVTLSACGGGGGNASGGVEPGITPTPTANVLALSVVDTSDVAVNSISFGAGQRIKARYTNAAGVPITYKLVSFSVSVNATAVTVAPTSNQTGVDGVAYVNVSPATASTVGAARVSAAADETTGSIDVGISATSVSLSSLALGATTLGAGGTTTVSVTARARSALASGVPVAFSATCGTLTPSIGQTDGFGVAATTYSAVKSDGASCQGRIMLSAVASGSTQTNELVVLAPIASAINFVAAAPSQIYILGSGAAAQSIVSFKVLDAQGVNYSGASVIVSLTSNPGGVGLNAPGAIGNLPLTSDSAGLVTFSVFSGTVPGPVEVKAALVASDAYAVSKNLSVQSGPPSQKFFSVAASTFNIEGRDYQGTTTTLTVQAANRNGTSVPVGTVVNFTAEGGQVSPSCTMTMTLGITSCAATFSSQSPLTSDRKVSVLAYTEGLKDFIDVNGNNIFDSGDTLVDMGDAYRDDDENGTYDAASGEFVVKRGGTLACPGAGGDAPSRANTCSGQIATTVRRQLVLIMSGSFAAFQLQTVSTGQITFVLTDDEGINPMPAGTTIASTAVDNTPLNNLACTAKKTFPATILSTTAPGTGVGITLAGCASGDQISVDVTTPKGNVTNQIFSIP